MEIRTVLLIILAVVAAFAVVFYQYFYGTKKKGSQGVVLAALRFVSILIALLLLINPKFTRNEYYLEKTNLVLLVDQSSSMAPSGSNEVVADLVTKLQESPELGERFQIQPYSFGAELANLDSISFEQKNTDIAKAISGIEEIFVNSSKAIVLISDGNQTLGRDYEFARPSENTALYPIVIGDTTQYEDLSIGLINTNTYAFLKNKFPVEAQLNYYGKRPVSKRVSIQLNGQTVYGEKVALNSTKNTHTINTLIEAKSVGLKSLRVLVEPLEWERNTENNSRESAIEVIDEKTKVVIVSDMPHPDIGALKKAIEVNEQRSVSLLKPTDPTDRFQDVDLFILYQPNRRFKNVYDFISKVNGSVFTIAGSKTDWGFLNQIQQHFFLENLNQSEEIIPTLNKAFGVFGLDGFSVTDFPPLIGNLGDIELKTQAETLMFQRIRGVDLDKPLFAIFTQEQQKEAILFGENIWRWRAQVFRNTQSFAQFDELIGKMMVYLASDGQRSRLELDYDFVFQDASLAKIRASYFDKSYQFDSNANLSIRVQGKDNEFERESPMLLKGSFFETDLSDLEAGDYNFQVTVANESLQRAGVFKILDFNPEKHFVSSNYGKLKRAAERMKGQVYFPNQVDDLIANLSSSQEYVPVQKGKQNVVSLIDFRVLLGLMALSLALEWFIRKYNGLI